MDPSLWNSLPELFKTKKPTGLKSLQLNFWEINQVTSKCQIDFCTKLSKEILNRKSEHYHKILHIQISLGTKFSSETDSFEFLDKTNTKRVSLI